MILKYFWYISYSIFNDTIGVVLCCVHKCCIVLWPHYWFMYCTHNQLWFILSLLFLNGTLGLMVHFVVIVIVVTRLQDWYTNTCLIYPKGRNCQRQTHPFTRYLREITLELVLTQCDYRNTYLVLTWRAHNPLYIFCWSCCPQTVSGSISTSSLARSLLWLIQFPVFYDSLF